MSNYFDHLLSFRKRNIWGMLNRDFLQASCCQPTVTKHWRIRVVSDCCWLCLLYQLCVSSLIDAVLAVEIWSQYPRCCSAWHSGQCGSLFISVRFTLYAICQYYQRAHKGICRCYYTADIAVNVQVLCIQIQVPAFKQNMSALLLVFTSIFITVVIVRFAIC